MKGWWLHSLQQHRLQPTVDADVCASVFAFSWGLVQPDILSVPELCHHVAEAWVSATVLASGVVQYKHRNPGTVRSTRRFETCTS